MPRTVSAWPCGKSQAMSATARNIGSSTMVRGISAAPNVRLMAPSSSARKNSALLLIAASFPTSPGGPVKTQPMTRWSSLNTSAWLTSPASSACARGSAGEPRKLSTTQRPALTCRSNDPPVTRRAEPGHPVAQDDPIFGFCLICHGKLTAIAARAMGAARSVGRGHSGDANDSTVRESNMALSADARGTCWRSRP
jgi:hypothetical protein